MAQTGGILLSQLDDFLQKIVLAKVSTASFDFVAQPGDVIRLTANLLSRQADGALVEGHVEVNGKKQGELALTFAILDDSFGTEPFFIPSDFCRILRVLRLFDVAVNPDGTPIKIPDAMLEAEIEALTVKPT